jgi:hypothetical protein
MCVQRVCLAVIVVSSLMAHRCCLAKSEDQPIQCAIEVAVPDALAAPPGKECWQRSDGDLLLVGNDLIIAAIDRKSGVLREIQNRTKGSKYPIVGDQMGIVLRVNGAAPREWLADGNTEHQFDVSFGPQQADPQEHQLRLTEQLEKLSTTIVYTLRPDRFWIERRLEIDADGQPLEIDRTVYGSLKIPDATSRELEIGRFDRPRIESQGEGGVFGGVGFWHYQVDANGLYFNGEDTRSLPRFTSEPWYVGVFETEPGEPWAGWLWYKTFLERRKAEHDRQPSWCYWNAGWGQWGIDIYHPAARPYIDLAARLGVRSICFGSGSQGPDIDEYIELAKSDSTTRQNLAFCKERGVAAGSLKGAEAGDDPENMGWVNPERVAYRHNQLQQFADAGYNAYYFDFFKTADTPAAHRNVAEFFREARQRLQYTECHLGMAVYGPQFQREVLINHPDDLADFDISRFSTDWATFLGFRHSRAGWQQKYEYLMPEYGLYYFLTHYSNWGHPRRYTDPEPTQFLYRPHAYCGIAYNFHDTVGFRESVAAVSAFSPYYVFGHLELKMPERDIAFVRGWIDWVGDNADVLRPARVCAETPDYGIVSKLQGGRGLVYLLNYSPGTRRFSIQLPASKTKYSLQTIYPKRTQLEEQDGSRPLDISVRGESLVILDVNDSLQSLPPENHSVFPIDVDGWVAKEAGTAQAEFELPDVRAALDEAADSSLPRELVSIDQLGDQAAERLTAEQINDKEVVDWIGKGRLPKRFLELYSFRDDRYADTWKFAPWAYTDRIWFVYRPAKPVPMNGPLPTVTVNGQTLELIPRVDYRRGEPEEWNCPVFFADITPHARFGSTNKVRLAGIAEVEPANCFVISGGDRR